MSSHLNDDFSWIESMSGLAIFKPDGVDLAGVLENGWDLKVHGALLDLIAEMFGGVEKDFPQRAGDLVLLA